MPSGAMDGSTKKYYELDPGGRNSKGEKIKHCDGGYMPQCACVLGENWYADYPKGSKWKAPGYSALTADGRYKTMRAWLENEGVDIISNLYVSAVTGYTTYLSENGAPGGGKGEMPKNAGVANGITLQEALDTGYLVAKQAYSGVNSGYVKNIIVELRYTSDADGMNILGSTKKGKIDESKQHTGKSDCKYANIYTIKSKAVYTDELLCKDAYLTPDTWKKLGDIQKQLDEEKGGWRIVVWDSIRPDSVQKDCYEDSNIPKQIDGSNLFSKSKQGGGKGSTHSFGMAVDASLVKVNASGKITEYLDVGQETYFPVKGGMDNPFPLGYRWKDKKKGGGHYTDILTEGQIANREKLYALFKASDGWIQHSNEWWHYENGGRGPKIIM